ncbi:MAG: hypothetical protein JXB32_06435 [Deltaproteobacteria bacterium]|nr:hypothetical protein [Deltaproteobacteria bacterium]
MAGRKCINCNAILPLGDPGAVAALALLCCAGVPATARATGEPADTTTAEVAPPVAEALDRTHGPSATIDADAGPAPDEGVPPDDASSPDEQTGYYYTFAFVATVGELFGGFALGLGIAGLVDGYDRDRYLSSATTPDDAAEIASGADDRKTLGWATLGVGTLTLGLGLALDLVLGEEFGDDDWWLRVGVTTPLATAGMALLASGVVQLDRSTALQSVSPRLATLEARDVARRDAADAETTGWILIGVGAAAIIGAATVWLKDAFEVDEQAGDSGDDEDAGPSVALFPLTLPSGGGLGLLLAL